MGAKEAPGLRIGGKWREASGVGEMTMHGAQQQTAFPFDVFLSHSSADKPKVRGVAERLRKDGLRVWFDEWLMKPGDSIYAKVEEGLESSRILVLCMSANSFGSDWARLEAGTFRFRDPLNRSRRFIPLRLDDAPIAGSLAQFLFVDWRGPDREQQYRKLLDACRPTVEKSEPPSLPSASSQLDLGKRQLTACAFNPAGTRALTASTNGTLRISDVDSGRMVAEIGRAGERVEYHLLERHRKAGGDLCGRSDFGVGRRTQHRIEPPAARADASRNGCIQALRSRPACLGDDATSEHSPNHHRFSSPSRKNEVGAVRSKRSPGICFELLRSRGGRGRALVSRRRPTLGCSSSLAN